MVGFRQPESARFPAQYAKVEQVPYQSSWHSEYGNDGGHWSAMTPRFASGWLAPRLIAVAQGSADKSARADVERATYASGK